jgi:hypothetical protein
VLMKQLTEYVELQGAKQFKQREVQAAIKNKKTKRKHLQDGREHDAMILSK